ncbi:MAG TPA: 2-C-methyl-D-erythritol 4-phosphate cytidylyltransferase [Longimicrobiales bacterium]
MVPPIRAAVVVAAGGAGRRMGGARKQYAELLGEPILLHSLRPFLAHPSVVRVVVALPAEDAAEPPAWLAELAARDARIALVAGGAERGDSVHRGLEAVPESVDVVLVHDAARPLVTRAVIERTLAAASGGVGAVAAVPVTDTLKQVGADGRIVGTPDRSVFQAAQTPQAFPRAMLLDAYRRAARDGVAATDDAALVERYGGKVVVVEGAPENIKVTRPIDLVVAEALLRARVAAGGC